MRVLGAADGIGGPGSRRGLVAAALARLSVIVPAMALGVPPTPASVAGQEGGQPCPRSAPRTFAVGSVTDIEERDPPCRFEFRPTGVRLEASPNGSWPDPSIIVVRDSRGRYYTASSPGFRETIAVWSPDGEFLTSFGRHGEGPGEFPSRGYVLKTYIDEHDQLHVRSGGTWSIFSPDHEFIRRYASWASALLINEPMSAILDGGEVLTGDVYESDRKNFFRIVRPDGTVVNAFGPADPGLDWEGRESLPPYHVISYEGGDTFWAARNFSPDWPGWIAEEWGLDGTARRVIRRRVPRYTPFQANSRPGGGTVIHADLDAGLLYVTFLHMTPEGRERAVNPERIGREERRDGLFAMRAEMIDLRSGELLAAEVYPAEEAVTFMPVDIFRGSMEGFMYRETEAGLPFVEVIEVKLVAK